MKAGADINQKNKPHLLEPTNASRYCHDMILTEGRNNKTSFAGRVVKERFQPAEMPAPLLLRNTRSSTRSQETPHAKARIPVIILPKRHLFQTCREKYKDLPRPQNASPSVCVVCCVVANYLSLGFVSCCSGVQGRCDEKTGR